MVCIELGAAVRHVEHCSRPALASVDAIAVEPQLVRVSRVRPLLWRTLPGSTVQVKVNAPSHHRQIQFKALALELGCRRVELAARAEDSGGS